MRRFRRSRLWLALRHSSQPSHDPNSEEVTSRLEVVKSRLRAHLAATSKPENEYLAATSKPENEHLEATSKPENGQAPPARKRTSSLLPTTGINAFVPIEVLQHILSYVPLWSLLRSRRVCHLWNDCISITSSALRTALYLPSPSDKSVSDPITLHFTIMISAIIIDVVPCEPPLHYSMHMNPEEVARLQGLGITLHPIFLGTVSECTIRGFKDRWIAATVGPVAERTENPSWWGDHNGPQPVRPLNLPLPEDTPEWIHMLACYPPVKKILLKFKYEDDISYTDYIWPELHASAGKVENVNGVKLGDLVSEVYRLVNIE